MEIEQTEIAGVLVAEISPIVDDRGFFSRVFCHDEFAEHGVDLVFVQANTALSDRRLTVRGMHHQLEPDAEYKLVRCTSGAVFDVAVDLRGDSATYGAWVGLELTAENRRSILVPPGVAHGYLTLEPYSELTYWTTRMYAPESAVGVRYDDPTIGIAWPEEPLVVSDQDRSWPLIAADGGWN
jgi:dTDP-4-dehydrorhamnose 3,5-epimerase